MKKPSILSKLKLENLLPFHELGMDVDSDQCRELGKKLKKFYFGFSAVSPETIFVYLMVNFNGFFLLIFAFQFSCYD